MKVLKYICLFVVYPVILLGCGFLGGVAFMQYFYPGKVQLPRQETIDMHEISTDILKTDEKESIYEAEIGLEGMQSDGRLMSMQEARELDASKKAEEERLEFEKELKSTEEVAWDVMNQPEVLGADTAYVLEEIDLRNHSVVETTWRLPAKYIGMDREAFLEAMDSYEASPPLEELERGFVSLEVLSFSQERVVVQMNYEYVQPGNSFYLMVMNNYVVVYLEDMKTVYMDTDILLKDLPDDIQQDIIHVMYIPDEESLYDFLENYSS